MKNPLKGKKLYLSGPIEHDDMGFNWRTEPKKTLSERFEMDVFDPFEDPKQVKAEGLKKAQEKADFDEMERIAKQFVRKDLKKVDKSDLVIAYLPYRVCTTGTKDEINLNWRNHNPTLLVCPEGKQYVPLWYYGIIPHKYFFGSWEDCYDFLQSVIEGSQKDDFLWAWMYDLI
jgi:hypothetical protein